MIPLKIQEKIRWNLGHTLYLQVPYLVIDFIYVHDISIHILISPLHGNCTSLPLWNKFQALSYIQVFSVAVAHV